MKRYQGKKVVTIGGTSGMGLAAAKMLLDGGARVLVTGRSSPLRARPRGNIVFGATFTIGAELPLHRKEQQDA